MIASVSPALLVAVRHAWYPTIVMQSPNGSGLRSFALLNRNLALHAID